MNFGLFGASVFAAAIAVTPAFADPLFPAFDRFYEDPAEGLRSIKPPPPECLNAAGANVCVAVLIAMDGQEGLLWAPMWSVQDERLECTDRGTANYRVDCDAPDAVRSRQVALPVPCVQAPGETAFTCGPARYLEKPYRPTPGP